MVDDKIDPSDTGQDMIVKLSEGNPGAATVLSQVMESKGPKEFVNFATSLDRFRIYGPDIWRGYKDHCGQDIDTFYDKIIAGDDVLLDFLDVN